ncbi:MAG TPA: YCF48-related protein [Melioribacteraceae bacterium]|nr:YCF48-related protein [Melioribacteraceae bacterium]
MKKIFTIVLLLVSCVFNFAQIQITKIRQATFKGDLRCFSYSANKLYVVGYNLGVVSFVQKSTDYGTTWEDVSGGFASGDNLTAISFATENLGLVAGASGVIYRTTNGGNTWLNVSPSGIYNGGINSIVMLNNQLAYACGSANGGFNIIKSTDGGLSWAGVNTGNTNTMYKMNWSDLNNCVVVGASGKFLKTTDGGNTWLSGTVTGSTAALYDVVKVDNNTYYATGTTGIFAKSTDGGNTFFKATTIASTTFYAINFKDLSNGVALGSSGVAFKTTDAGVNWSLVDTYTSEVIRTCYLVNNILLGGAYRSTLIKSTDFGLTWVNLANSSRDIYGINIENGTDNIVVAADRGEVNYSTNIGITWEKTNFTTGDILYDVVKFNNNIYACGRAGAFFVSTNTGLSWLNKSIGTSTTRLYKLFFFDAEKGYTVTNEGKILYTTNAGTTWLEHGVFSNTTLYDIYMLSPTVGFSCGSGDRLFGTVDGLNWTHGAMAKPNGQVTGIFMLNEQKGYICGENGAVYKTTDGFRTIQLLTDTLALNGKLIHDVFAFDENNVYAVGQGGIVLKTVSPNQMNIITTLDEQQDLLDIAKFDDASLLISGANGLVYKISDLSIPVKLVSFYAEISANNVILNWKTATETNNSGFEIQRKLSNGNLWQKVLFIKGEGTSTEINEYNFIDHNLLPNSYNYRLKQIDYDGSESYSKVIEVNLVELPLSIMLEQNYPNPFNPKTNIKFSIPQKQFVSLKVFNILGKEIITLVNEELNSGNYLKVFNANNLSSGVYFFQLQAGETRLVKKMNLIK